MGTVEKAREYARNGMSLYMDTSEDCYYEQALNMKNFIKRLRRQGIIGADECVKIVK